jgi:hypothetical protein
VKLFLEYNYFYKPGNTIRFLMDMGEIVNKILEDFFKSEHKAISIIGGEERERNKIQLKLMEKTFGQCFVHDATGGEYVHKISGFYVADLGDFEGIYEFGKTLITPLFSLKKGL